MVRAEWVVEVMFLVQMFIAFGVISIEVKEKTITLDDLIHRKHVGDEREAINYLTLG